mmetsp:Transcript_3427/g.7813  ORF Transcript_3427/g.7813 Transcript_3427/m.7813 type:complete len:162 (+) Transcript_3427:51-536(+)
MDLYMKDLLANRPNVVIVEDSARMHFDKTQRYLYSEQSSAEMEASTSKADARWKCKSQSPSIDDNSKTKDIPIEKPPKRRLLRSSFTASTKSSTKGAKKAAKSSKAEQKLSTPNRLPSAEDPDANKAQRIIDLVQSLAFRAATAVQHAKQNERESATRASE